MTWFRKRGHWNSFKNDEVEKIVSFVNARISERLKG